MRFAFDHLVQYMEDPKAAIPFLKDKGIHTVEGGEHQGLGSYNVLSYFDLSYLEFFGVKDRESFKKIEHPKHSLMETIVQDGFTEGFSRFVVRTENIFEAAEHFRNLGLTVNGPIARSRRRPDGSVLTWHLLYVGTENKELEMPYIIQWDDNDEERRKELIEKGVIVPQSVELAFSELLFAVHNGDETIKKWSERLGLQEINASFIDEELQAECRTLGLPGGNLVFCSPIGDGIVSDVLKERGEKPFQANLSGGEVQAIFNLFGGRFKVKHP